MIKAKLSLELQEGDNIAVDQLEVSAKNLDILRPLVLRTTLLSFAESVQETLNEPDWHKELEAAAPKKKAASAKKATKK